MKESINSPKSHENPSSKVDSGFNKFRNAIWAISLSALAIISSCTQKERAKNFGGSITINLPMGEELIEATWKNDDLWYLTRRRKKGETIDTLTFKEDSSYGIMEGEVVFIEH